MSKRIFLDTVFVIALINSRDQNHKAAVKLADRLDAKQLLTTDAVLLEIGNGLARNFKQAAVGVIERFLTVSNVEVVHLNPDLFGQALSLYKTHHDKAWGLVDCLSFVVMREAGVTEALTFDQDFAQAGFRMITAGETAK